MMPTGETKTGRDGGALISKTPRTILIEMPGASLLSASPTEKWQ